VSTHIRQYLKAQTDYFTRLAEMHDAADVQRVGLPSRIGQRKRFEALLRVAAYPNPPLNTGSLLDVGCGVGDLYGLLCMDWGLDTDYLGIDLVEANVRAATGKYGSGLFDTVSVFDDRLNKVRFDYVVASGIFFMKDENWSEIVKKTLARMFELSKYGIAANFLSMSRTGAYSTVAHYASEMEVLLMARELSKKVKVEISHDYLPDDFTVYAWR
jgi:hypothetical protein